MASHDDLLNNHLQTILAALRAILLKTLLLFLIIADFLACSGFQALSVPQPDLENIKSTDQKQIQPGSPDSTGDKGSECGVISDVDKNYLTPIDVVVKNEDNTVACIRARFALSIKVEEAFELPHGLSSQQDDRPAKDNGTSPQMFRAVLGYLPLENVIKVEDTCPDEAPSNATSNKETKSNQDESKSDQAKLDDLQKTSFKPTDQQEMIITFECGKLSFTFRRDKDRYYMSSIEGIVKLGK